MSDRMALSGTYGVSTEGGGRVFRLHSLWELDSEIDEALAIFHDMDAMVDWWSAAFMRMEVMEPGGADSIGKTVRLHTKGWLPHSFQFMARIKAGETATTVGIDVAGDFHGEALMAMEKVGGRLMLAFDWHIHVDHPWVRFVAALVRPVLAWNHRWVMRIGQAGLQREIYRRRGDLAAMTRVPEPRRIPTFPHNIPIVMARYGWHRNVQAWPTESGTAR